MLAKKEIVSGRKVYCLVGSEDARVVSAKVLSETSENRSTKPRIPRDRKNIS